MGALNHYRMQGMIGFGGLGFRAGKYMVGHHNGKRHVNWGSTGVVYRDYGMKGPCKFHHHLRP